MADRSHGGLWRWIAVGAGVVVCAAVLAGSTTGSSTAVGVRLRVLQLNLCNSGIESCYTGHSVARAAAVIGSVGPNLVTLNEVCRDDVSNLERVLSEGARDGDVVSAFQPAADRRTAAAFQCRNGQPAAIRRGADVGTVSRNAPGGSPSPRHAPAQAAARRPQRCREPAPYAGLFRQPADGSAGDEAICGDAAAEGPPRAIGKDPPLFSRFRA